MGPDRKGIAAMSKKRRDSRDKPSHSLTPLGQDVASFLKTPEGAEFRRLISGNESPKPPNIPQQEDELRVFVVASPSGIGFHVAVIDGEAFADFEDMCSAIGFPPPEEELEFAILEGAIRIIATPEGEHRTFLSLSWVAKQVEHYKTAHENYTSIRNQVLGIARKFRTREDGR